MKFSGKVSPLPKTTCMRAVFKPDTTLKSYMVIPKDAVAPTEEKSVAHSIHFSLSMRLLQGFIPCQYDNFLAVKLRNVCRVG